MTEKIPISLREQRFVDEIRRRMVMERRSMIGFNVLVTTAFLGGFGYITHQIWRLYAATPEISEDVSLGLLLGSVLGLLLGVLATATALSIISLLRVMLGSETDRLLLKYHDHIKEHDGFQQGG